MGAGFIRRYTDDPGNAELLAIEGVVILDRDPPATIQGIGTGYVTLIGEWENGPFNVPTQLTSGDDLKRTFGGFGYAYDGQVGGNPCARSRKADSAASPEYWNGNGFIATWGKTFARLIVVRVDTSVGEVQFTREASLSGNPDFTFALTSGQTLDIDTGGGSTTATFTGTPATKTSADGTYPSTFTGGEKMTVALDGAKYTIVFLAADQSHTQVVARMNLAVGYTAFTESTLKTVLTGRQGGTGGSVQIVSIDAAVATATGFSAGAATAGTGNVANIAAVTVTEVNTIVHAAESDVNVDRDAAGNIRMINTAAPGTGTLKIASTSTALAFGFPLDTTADATKGVAGTIPAGTRVRTAGGTEFVTMQDVAVTSSSAGPYSVKVRHALDDGTGTGQNVSTLTVVPYPIALGAFAASNNLAIGAALTESQIDAKYSEAIDTTISLRSIAKSTNIIVSARQSNLIRTRLRSNAPNASSSGCNGRITVVRPPLGTTRAKALSTSAQPGVGAYRHERLDYAYPGVNVQIPEIAVRGTSGGAGFSADGRVDVGFDTWVAALMSNLRPEENPGQLTAFLLNILDVEQGNADVQSLTIGDYEAFKAAGIMAPRIDNGDVVIQSGVTSVDPASYPNLANVARRRFADFLQDSVAPRLNVYAKKMSTAANRGAVVGELDAFLRGLQSPQNPSASRLQAYSLDAKSLNTPDDLAAGLFRVRMKVRMWPSMDVIVLDSQVGENVQITEPAVAV